MTADPTWISLLPPLLAIGLAIWSREVYLSLAAGIVLGWTILSGWNPLAGLGAAIDGTVAVFSDSGNTSVILFTLVIGALIGTLEMSGGVAGFVDWVEHKGWVGSKRGARLMAWVIGTVIFIESNITVLVAGSLSRPLFDRFRVSRAKLAYLIDSTSAPICVLIPLNAWGAYVLGLLGTAGVEEPLGEFVSSMPLNFYAITAWLLAGWIAWSGRAVGPMASSEAHAEAGKHSGPELRAEDGSVAYRRRKASTMILPILAMIVMMPVGLYVTGDGSFADGSGATSVLWAVLTALGVAWLLLLTSGATPSELTEEGLGGAGKFIGLALIMLLALALGAVTRELGTGAYVAGVVGEAFPPAVLLPLIFVIAGFTAFSTGTSWGTFAIMIPIAVPIATTLGLPIAPFLAAVLSGGIFGDHSSPISDTTIVSSIAAAVDHIEHVRTQLPYALVAGGIAATGFAIVGGVIG